MRAFTATINGEAHEVRELPARANSQWRAGFEKQFGALVDLVGQLPDTDISNAGDLAGLVRRSAGVFLSAFDQIFEMAVAYDAAFADAYDSEIADAFPQIVELAFPFGPLVTRGKRLLGDIRGPTSPS